MFIRYVIITLHTALALSLRIIGVYARRSHNSERSGIFSFLNFDNKINLFLFVHLQAFIDRYLVDIFVNHAAFFSSR